MLNPIHLRTLRECVRTRSFAKAARALGYTASAVSQQMGLLERAVGAVLFERSARSVRPTAVAETLARRSDYALDALGLLEREIRAVVDGDHGTLRLASFATANSSVLPDTLAAIVARRPQAQVQLDEGEPDEVLDGLCVGHLDAAVVFEYDLDPRAWPTRLASVELLAEPLMIVTRATADGGAEPTALTELANEPWICTRADTAGARALEKLTARAGFTPRIVFRSNDYGVIGELVARGLGVALMPLLAVRNADVRALPLSGVDSYRRVRVLYRSDNANPLLPVALDCLSTSCAKLAARDGMSPGLGAAIFGLPPANGKRR